MLWSELGRINQGNFLKLFGINGGKYHFNVGTLILQGMLHTAELDLVPSQMAEIIFSPFLHESSTRLFFTNFKGHMFTIFYHPSDQVTSCYTTFVQLLVSLRIIIHYRTWYFTSMQTVNYPRITSWWEQ